VRKQKEIHVFLSFCSWPSLSFELADLDTGDWRMGALLTNIEKPAAAPI
jgi:hypothetical protein